MDESRRDFFKGLAAAAAGLVVATIGGKAVASIPGENPRVKAGRLLFESRDIFKAEGKGDRYKDKTDELFQHLMDHFPVTNPPSDEVLAVDCGDMLKGRGVFRYNSFNTWKTCYPSTFSIMIVRHGLKDLRLPMIQAPKWKKFAKGYTKIVMAA